MSPIRYLNFDLLIQPSEAGYIARVLHSPCGQAGAEFIRPFSDLELENFLLRVGRPRRGVRRLESSEREAVRTLGGQLFDAVFHDEVETCLRRSMDEAARQETGLRIRLRLDAPELREIPWEFLHDVDNDRFLTLSATTPLVRSLDLPERILPLEVEPPLRVLVMISSPAGGAELDVEREWAKLKEAVGPLQARGLLELARLPAATLTALQRQLRRDQYHIFHYVGHGAFDERSQDGVLLLEDEDGRGRPVSGRDLGAMLYDHRSLRLALLNACEGARTSHTDPFAGVAQSLLRQRIPAVIAMQFEIPDEAAIALASEFYAALADGYPVDAALAEARRALYARGGDVEWGTPVLYLHASDGQIFDVQPVSEPVPTEPVASTLYAEALATMAVEDWSTAAEKLQAVLAQDPDHGDAAARLEQVQQELELSTLYNRGHTHYQARRWREATEYLRQVRALRTGYKDADSLLAAAEQQLAEAEQAPHPTPSRTKRWPWIAIAAAVVLLLAIATGTYVALTGGATPTPTDVAAVPSATMAAPSPVPTLDEAATASARATAQAATDTAITPSPVPAVDEAATASARATAQAATDTTPILFTSNRGGSQDIWSILPDGSDLQQLTNDPGIEERPSWSPDRSGFVFAYKEDSDSDGDLVMADATGGNWTWLTRDEFNDLHPAWSPDGEGIAFVSKRDGDYEIYVYEIAEKKWRQVTENDGWDSYPAWSPDGDRIVYTSQRGGNFDLYLVDLSTGQEQRLTTNPYTDAYPSWSPVRDQIVYMREVDPGTGKREIAILDPNDPGQPRVVTQDTSVHGYPDWSPDGQWIVFGSEVGDNTEISLIPAEGGAARNLTQSSSQDTLPVWTR